MSRPSDDNRPMNGKTGENDAVEPVPAKALADLDEEIDAAGGPQHLPAEYEGSVGRTMFDSPASEDNTVTVLLPREQIDQVPSQALVRIDSVPDGRRYLGVVVAGPFADPDGLRADFPLVVTTVVRGGIFMPRFHGRVQVELLGEEIDGVLVPPRFRPLPNSPVFVLGPTEMAAALQIAGDVRLGLAVGHENVAVAIPSRSKAVLPRHLAILGTTGGGKSTTVSGLIYRLQQANVATIVIDTEGEYTELREPTSDPTMVRALRQQGREPEGVRGTVLYHLVGRETTSPDHPRRHPFALRFAELSPYAVMEILDLNDAQQERFLKAYDVAKRALERLGIFPTNDRERQEALEVDELETGYPRLTLAHLHDVVKLIAAKTAKEPTPSLTTAAFEQRKAEIEELLTHDQLPGNVASWRALLGKIGRIRRLNVFDRPDCALDYTALIQPGWVSIVDLSDSDSPQINNLVIAQVLRGVQRAQEEAYRRAQEGGEPLTPVEIVVEEAHEFLAAERIRQMPVLFQQVTRIARRGRKRWLGLVFVTQLPQHLPDEVFGLVNNYIIHKIGDANVISRLKRSIGGIDDSLWRRLPGLAPGQAIVSFVGMARPLLVAIDPTPARLRMVE